MPHKMEHCENMFELFIVADQPVRDLSPGFYDQARNLDKSMIDPGFEYYWYPSKNTSLNLFALDNHY